MRNDVSYISRPLKFVNNFLGKHIDVVIFPYWLYKIERFRVCIERTNIIAIRSFGINADTAHLAFREQIIGNTFKHIDIIEGRVLECPNKPVCIIGGTEHPVKSAILVDGVKSILNPCGLLCVLRSVPPWCVFCRCGYIRHIRFPRHIRAIPHVFDGAERIIINHIKRISTILCACADTICVLDRFKSRSVSCFFDRLTEFPLCANLRNQLLRCIGCRIRSVIHFKTTDKVDVFTKTGDLRETAKEDIHCGIQTEPFNEFLSVVCFERIENVHRSGHDLVSTDSCACIFERIASCFDCRLTAFKTNLGKQLSFNCAGKRSGHCELRSLSKHITDHVATAITDGIQFRLVFV